MFNVKKLLLIVFLLVSFGVSVSYAQSLSIEKVREYQDRFAILALQAAEVMADTYSRFGDDGLTYMLDEDYWAAWLACMDFATYLHRTACAYYFSVEDYNSAYTSLNEMQKFEGQTQETRDIYKQQFGASVLVSINKRAEHWLAELKKGNFNLPFNKIK